MPRRQHYAPKPKTVLIALLSKPLAPACKCPTFTLFMKIVKGTLLWQIYLTTIKILIGAAIGRASILILIFMRESILSRQSYPPYKIHERIG